MRKFCKKHRTILGCTLAGLTFIALHVAIPALVAGTVVHVNKAHAVGSGPPFDTGTLERLADTAQFTVYKLTMPGVRDYHGNKTCVIVRTNHQIELECL